MIELSALTLWALSTWAVLTKHVRDGIVVKFGLMIMSVGFFGVVLAQDGIPAYKSVLVLLGAGALICIFGIVLRLRGNHAKNRNNHGDGSA